MPTTHTKHGDRAFSCAAPRLWNELPISIKNCPSTSTFKQSVKTYLFNWAYCWCLIVDCLERLRTAEKADVWRYIKCFILLLLLLSRGQNKMAAVGHLEFLCFDIIASETHVMPHFWLIWIHWFHWYDYFYDLRSCRRQKQDGWIFNFWQNSPRILCNTSFLTNFNAQIQLVWLFLWFKVI